MDHNRHQHQELDRKLYLYRECQVLFTGDSYHIITHSGGRLQLDATKVSILPCFIGKTCLCQRGYWDMWNVEVYDYATQACIPLFLEIDKWGVSILYGVNIKTNPELIPYFTLKDSWLPKSKTANHKIYYWKQEDNKVLYLNGINVYGELLEHIPIFAPIPEIMAELDNDQDYYVKFQDRTEFFLENIQTDTKEMFELSGVFETLEKDFTRYQSRCLPYLHAISAHTIQWLDCSGDIIYSARVYLHWDNIWGRVVTDDTIMLIYRGDWTMSTEEPIYTVLPEFLLQEEVTVNETKIDSGEDL